MADLGDTGEALRYLVGFWAVLFSPRQRSGILQRWRAARWPDRAVMVLHGTVSALVGLGLPLAGAWIVMRWVAG